MLYACRGYGWVQANTSINTYIRVYVSRHFVCRLSRWKNGKNVEKKNRQKFHILLPLFHWLVSFTLFFSSCQSFVVGKSFFLYSSSFFDQLPCMRQTEKNYWKIHMTNAMLRYVNEIIVHATWDYIRSTKYTDTYTVLHKLFAFSGFFPLFSVFGWSTHT